MNSRLVRFLRLNWMILVCCIALSLGSFSLSANINPDCYFMVRHADDIMINGFDASIDFLSMHDGLPFSHQKWAMCFLEYWVYDTFGLIGLGFAGGILGAMMFIMMVIIMNHYNPKHKFITVFVCLLLWFLLSCFISFRPQILSVMFLLLLFIAMEHYIHILRPHLKDRIKLGLVIFIVGVLMMWFHSTMWIFGIVFMMPYVCDFRWLRKIRFLDRFLKFDDSKRSLPLWSLGIYAITIFLQPNGLYEVKYVLSCLTASSAECYHVASELVSFFEYMFYRPITFLMFMIPILILFSFLYYNIRIGWDERNVGYHKKQFPLRAVYMFLGSILFLFSSVRLILYVAILIFMMFCIVLRNRQDDDCYENDGIMRFFSCVISIVALSFGFHFAIMLSNSEMNYLDDFKKTVLFDSIDTLYVYNQQDIKIMSQSVDVMSYSEFLGMKPYMDGRLEYFYYPEDNILQEFWEIFSDGQYKGESIANFDVLKKFQDARDIDYYIAPLGFDIRWSDNMEEYAKQGLIYENCRTDSWAIYSFKHSDKFEPVVYNDGKYDESYFEPKSWR